MCESACNIDDASNGVVNKISIIVIPERGVEKRRGGESHDYNLAREGAHRPL